MQFSLLKKIEKLTLQAIDADKGQLAVEAENKALRTKEVRKARKPAY